MSAEVNWVSVVLDLPLGGPFDYRVTTPVAVGDRVIVPFGRRKMIGVVVDTPVEPSYDPKLVKEVEQVLQDVAPLTQSWLKFARFAAEYYQRPLGEVILPALPLPLRGLAAYQGKRAAGGPVARLDKRRKAAQSAAVQSVVPTLNPGQQAAIDAIGSSQGFKAFLLFGVTGSGKTEVYLHAAAQTLARGKRVLMFAQPHANTPLSYRSPSRQITGRP